MDVDWGLDQPSASFWSDAPTRGEERGRLHPVDSDEIDDLPDVRDAREQGWQPASEAPLWCYVPAIWPRSRRAWVPDLRIRHSTWMTSTGEVGRGPWSAWDHAEIEASYNSLLVECGLPPRPAGRVWLLQPPPEVTMVDEFLHQVMLGWEDQGGLLMPTAGLVDYTAERVAEAFRRPAG